MCSTVYSRVYLTVFPTITHLQSKKPSEKYKAAAQPNLPRAEIRFGASRSIYRPGLRKPISTSSAPKASTIAFGTHAEAVTWLRHLLFLEQNVNLDHIQGSEHGCNTWQRTSFGVTNHTQLLITCYFNYRLAYAALLPKRLVLSKLPRRPT